MLRLGLGALAAAVLAAAPALAATSSCGDPLACAGLRLQSAPLPWQPLTPEAQFARNTYTNTPAPADARLHVLVLRPGTGAAQYAGRVHATAPGTEVLVYQSLWLRPVPDPSGETTCLTGSTHYPASWFMHDAAGVPEEWHTGTLTGGYQMDFGNPDYLRACAAHALAPATAMGADGVFLDGIATSVHWGTLPAPCASATCANDRAWQDAMTRALAYLATQLHRHGLVLVANISGGNVDFCCGGGAAVWRRYVSTIDGAMEEARTYGTDGAPLPTSEVAEGLANVAWDESVGRQTIVNDDVAGCEPCATYGLATMLLAGQGLTSYDISNGSYGTYAGWSPSDAAAMTLGAPLGPYSTRADGLLVRRFARGMVAVNDTAAPIADAAFGTLAPHSAVIR